MTSAGYGGSWGWSGRGEIDPLALVTEELEVLTIVTGRLESAGIPYMVTGSIAANY